jgi:hypothetical protein
VSQTFSHINIPTFSNLVILHTYPLWKWDRVFWNISIQNSDTGKLPRRKHTSVFLLKLYFSTIPLQFSSSCSLWQFLLQGMSEAYKANTQVKMQQQPPPFMLILIIKVWLFLLYWQDSE